MKLTRTITIDGDTQAEYEAIRAYMQALAQQFPGWTLSYDPISRRVTAVRSEQLTQLP